MNARRRTKLVVVMNVAVWAAAAICALLIGWNALQVVGPATLRPVIHSPQTTIEFAAVDRGVNIERTFEIENVGGRPLVVRSVITTCGCTRISPSEFPITVPPDQSLPLHVSLDTSEKSGPVKAYAIVESNDASTPRLKLALSGEVRAAETSE